MAMNIVQPQPKEDPNKELPAPTDILRELWAENGLFPERWMADFNHGVWKSAPDGTVRHGGKEEEEGRVVRKPYGQAHTVLGEGGADGDDLKGKRTGTA